MPQYGQQINLYSIYNRHLQKMMMKSAE